MNEKYVRLSAVKKKLNHIYRVYGVSQKIKQTISDSRIPVNIRTDNTDLSTCELFEVTDLAGLNIAFGVHINIRCSVVNLDISGRLDNFVQLMSSLFNADSTHLKRNDHIPFFDKCVV